MWGSTSSKSKRLKRIDMNVMASMVANCCPKHVRGPAWKAGNFVGEALSPVNQRSGLYSLASGPQIAVARLQRPGMIEIQLVDVLMVNHGFLTREFFLSLPHCPCRPVEVLSLLDLNSVCKEKKYIWKREYTGTFSSHLHYGMWINWMITYWGEHHPQRRP